MKDDARMEFDAINLRLKEAGSRTLLTVKVLLVYFLVTLTLTVLAYALFALFFKTDTERELSRENRMYSKLMPALEQKEQLLGDAVAALQYKDGEIYGQVFHSSAPNVDPMATLDFLFASDTIPDERLVSYTRDKSASLLEKCAGIEECFTEIFAAVCDGSRPMPPMFMPVKDITYPQVGASVGKKMNPFYKAYVEHSGIDLIVPRGTPVYASADGSVTSGTGRKKSLGQVVEIAHDSIYTTRYAHLENVYVKAGQKVRRGQKIGTAGMSGKAFAPHLHYEVIRRGKNVDPANYMFASVSPWEYANMLYMAANTEQSMD